MEAHLRPVFSFCKRRLTAQRLSQFLIVLVCLSFTAAGHAAPGKWTTSENGSQRWLGYAATVPLLGKQTPVEIQFYCDPLPNAYAKSNLGVQWAILATGPLKPFRFEAFDETLINSKVENRLMEITIARKGQPDLTRQLRAAGLEPNKGIFIFELSAESKLPASEPREILQALAADGATSLKISLTDSKDAKLKLEVTVPLAGKQADFRKLLQGLR